MNKQYVIEKIDAAVEKVRAEYDPILKNIVECPVCGALTFRQSEHICLKSEPSTYPVKYARPAKKMLFDYIMDVLVDEPPAPDVEILEADSPYLLASIGKKVIEAGYPGKATSIGSNICKLISQSDGRIKRRPISARETRTRKSTGMEYESVTANFAYWRSG